jgi:hypothetical protein
MNPASKAITENCRSGLPTPTSESFVKLVFVSMIFPLSVFALNQRTFSHAHRFYGFGWLEVRLATHLAAG